MSKPLVAIVGRPNVGKSTLFNKIAGKRISIVEDTPGITRDRIYTDAEWNGKEFLLVDTGGIEPASDDVILREMRIQAELAIDTADVIILVTNIRDGVTATDADVAAMLLKSGKPIILACNKVDAPGDVPPEFYEFYNLGLGDPVAVSSVHGMGVGDLLDKVVADFQIIEEGEVDDNSVKVAVIGKPNAGKSSLINKIVGENRVIVSDIPGTTRDAIDTDIEINGTNYTFIDTAGIRRHSKVDEAVEKYSVIRALAAIERCDVAILMIDASQGATEQDAKIAGYADDAGKALILVVNKWDLIEKETNTMNKFEKSVYDRLSFVTYAPMLFISVKTGQRVKDVFETINFVNDKNTMRISTGMLNDVLNDATYKVQPPSDKGKRLKLYYITQACTRPPTFVIFVNNRELFHFSYQRYIENQIRTTFNLTGTPVRFIIRERGKEE